MKSKHLARRRPGESAPGVTRDRRARRHPLDIILTVGIGVLVAGALALFLYRPVMYAVSERRQGRAVDGYIAAVESLSDGETAAIASRAARYNEDYAARHPYIFAGLSADAADRYADVLRVPGTDAIGYLEVPAIDLRLPIYPGATEESLKKGCGHFEASSLPVAGETAHSYLAAHRNMTGARMFNRLGELRVGDTFSVTVLNTTLVYTVDEIRVVDPVREEDYATQRLVPGKNYCTLMTCHPDGSTERRLFVRGVANVDAPALAATNN